MDRGIPRSKWGNPFKVGTDGYLDQVIALYEKHLEELGLDAEVGELLGKTLLCHCKPDQKCHGDVLVDLLQEIP